MANRPKPVHQMTEREFETRFPFGDDDACKAYLKARRWPDGVRCPRAAILLSMTCTPASGIGSARNAPLVALRAIGFSVIAGTIFENTNKPLRDWFKVVHLMTTSKKGISALQIQRHLALALTARRTACATKFAPR